MWLGLNIKIFIGFVIALFLLIFISLTMTNSITLLTDLEKVQFCSLLSLVSILFSFYFFVCYMCEREKIKNMKENLKKIIISNLEGCIDKKKCSYMLKIKDRQGIGKCKKYAHRNGEEVFE